ncbi:MAG: iron-containing alcohol dehydrogenase [Caldilineaceae bacterium]|nr:iron-containing alcohol dehydrogenase [Caldilineaceae bacterium]
MNFEFATANKIIFGAGTLARLPGAAAALGTRVLVVTGQNPARAAEAMGLLMDGGLSCTTFAVDAEPTVELICRGVQAAKDANCDLVVSFGGGSVMDAGKAIAVLCTNPGQPLDYLEVIGQGQPLTVDPLPTIAIPTTAGTGAEVTKNAVLASPAHRVKVSLRHDKMLPNVALVDPLLTHSVPPALTASTGLDALTQLIEPFVSHLATPMTDGFCREGIRRAARGLRRAFRNGEDAQAREDMAMASLFGGLALANAKLGAVHGFAGPLGGMYPAPHGAVCGRLLPFATAVNVQALRDRDAQNPAALRYDEVAQLLTGDPQATINDGLAWLEELSAELAVPGLASYGVSTADFADIIAKSMNSSSMKGNPIGLTEEELGEILAAAL